MASAAAQAAMPNLVHIDSVEAIKGVDLRQFLQRRQVRGIILGGGPPCQGNSSLNRGRQGLNDPRSQQPSQLQRLREEILALPEAHTCEVITFLENVASMPQSVCEQYSTWLGGQPVLIDAAGCCTGWHPAPQGCHRGVPHLQTGSGTKARGTAARPYTLRQEAYSCSGMVG